MDQDNPNCEIEWSRFMKVGKLSEIRGWWVLRASIVLIALIFIVAVIVLAQAARATRLTSLYS